METRNQIDTTINVQTPEGIGFSLYPAGLIIRLCAFMIDLFAQGAFAIALVIIFSSPASGFYGIWIYLLCMFVLNWFYYVICELFFKGQSIGKRLMGIRVVRSDGSPINPGASFLRNLLRFADNFMGFYLIAFLCMAVSPGFRRLGDLAADTLVVYTGSSLAPTKKITMEWLTKYDTIMPPRKLSNREKQAIILFARRYPILGDARANEIAETFADRLREEKPEQKTYSGAEYLLGIAAALSGGRE